MLRSLTSRALFMSVLFVATLFSTTSQAQVTQIDYQIRYNDTDCLWDFYIIIVSGNATTIPQRAQFNAQYSFLVPTGTSVGAPVNHMPLQNNQSGSGTGTPMEWSYGSPAINPAAAPGFDFYPVVPKLAPASFFNNLTEGDTVKIFSVDIGIMPDCGASIRPFINGSDPASDAPGMGGGDFSNGYTLGSNVQLYNTNEPTIVPSSPEVEGMAVCLDNMISIDLAATTSACQTPLSYSWTGPNGYTSTDEDVSIANATTAANGTYNVRVTDNFGCTSTFEIMSEVKPDAGADIVGCQGESVMLQGSPTSGTWTEDASNGAGGSLTPGTSGAATVEFSATAMGTYNYVYTTETCSDTVSVNIVVPDAGPDPSALQCFSTGTATLEAVGTGTWSLGSPSAGTATIANPLSATTTVSGFSAEGTYTLVWDVGGCTDEVTIVVNGNCDCVITNNNLTVPSPNTFCGNSGAVSIDGASVPEAGSYAWEYSLDAAPFASAPGSNSAEDYTTDDLTEGNHRFRRVFTTSTGIICMDTTNIVAINVAPTPDAPTGITATPNEICVNETSTVSVTNISGAIYTWTASSSDAGMSSSVTNMVTLNPTVAGVYTISVTQTVNGCVSSPSTIMVTVNDVPPAPTAGTVSSTNPTACEAADGTITISGYMANTSYEVSYDYNGTTTTTSLTADASGNLLISNLASGSYTNITVASTAGCTEGAFSGPISLSDPDAPNNPTGLAASPNPECLGLPITVSVDDIPGATFSWSSNSTNAGLSSSTTNTVTMNANTAGLYTIFVNVTVNGCTSIDTFTTIQVNDAPPTPTATTVSGTNPTECGGADGFITISGYDASSQYTINYAKNGVATSIVATTNASGVLTISDLTEGTYTDFLVSNFTGCSSGTFGGPISLADPGSPDAPANISASLNPLCLGQSTVLTVDNVPGATFNWSASSADAGLGIETGNTVTATPTATGVFMISVSVSVAGCTSMSSTIDIQVGDTPATPNSITSENPTVCSGTDGTITIAGYTANETYDINYSFGGSSNSVSVTADGSGNLVIQNLGAGTYSDFRVTNSSNCPSETFTGPVSLVDPDAPDAPTDLTVMPNPICQGQTVTIETPNTVGATYTWSVSPADGGFVPNNTNSITFTPEGSGIFQVSVNQTINGCVSNASTPVNVIVAPSPDTPNGNTVSGMNPSGCQQADGSISISGLDANVSYGIQFDSAMVTVNEVITADTAGIAIISGVESGTYTNFIITNDNGCSSGTYSGPINLVDPGAPDAPTGLTAMPNPACLGQTIDLSVDNDPDATYTWSVNNADAGLMSAGNTATLDPTVAGTYTVTVSQSIADCTSPAAMITVTVSETPTTPTDIVGTNPTDCAMANGIITISGLTPNTMYTLTHFFNGSEVTTDVTVGANGDVLISDLDQGTYTNFSLSNTAGCMSGIFAGPIDLAAPSSPDAPTGLMADKTDICLGETIDLMVDDVAGAEFNWTILPSAGAGLVPSTTNTTTMTPTESGMYVVSVSLTINGCTSPAATININVRSLPEGVSAANSAYTDPTSCTTSDGSITLSGYDEGETYTVDYTFNGAAASTMITANANGELVLMDLEAGNYTSFNITDAFGCSSGPSSYLMELMQPGAPDAPTGLAGVPNPVCIGNTMDLSVDNMTGATFDWTISGSPTGFSSNGNSATFTPDTEGVYTVNVTQTIAGCTSSPALLEIQVLDFCLNPDFGVTYNDVELPGNLNTNDMQQVGSTYGNPVGLSSNPTTDIPVVNTDGTYTFTSSEPGEYYFTVDVCDATSKCVAMPLAITVLDIESTENPPVANHDYINTNANNSISINVLDNDQCQSFPNCSLGNVSISTPPVNGSFDVNTLTYTPNPNFVGVDSFLYEVCQNPATPLSCDEEWVYIDIYAEDATSYTNAMDDYNQTPLNTQIITTAANGVISNDNDPENETQRVNPISLTEAGKGDIVFNADGSYTFTPVMGFVGPVDFAYTVCRMNDNLICDNATLHILVEPMAATGIIESCVWEDVNGNGIFENGEPGIGEVEVSLYTEDGDLIATTTTDVQGNYQFPDVLQGNYFMYFGTVGEFEFTLPNVGSESTDSDVDGTNGPGTTALFTLNAGESLGNVKAGLFKCTKIGDNVWYDVNMNDVFDDTENGINGMEVNLYKRVNGAWILWDETKTGKKPNSPSDDGWFEFCTSPGDYYVEFVLPPTGLVQALAFVGDDKFRDSDVNNVNGPGTTPSFALVNGVDKLDLGAGYYPQAIVGNLVWHDEDMNGLQNSDEARIAGVLVEAFDANDFSLISSAVTNEDGIYELDSLSKRDVYFRFTPPAEMVATVADVGGDSFDSDVDHSYGENTTRMFSMNPGVFNGNIDFGVAYGALPVRWVDVDIKELDGDHVLSWTVEQEVDVERYEVLRKHESEESFTTISREEIIANNVLTSSKYNYIDNDVIRGGTYYYKIKQYDFDGKYHFSKIVSIDHTHMMKISLFPNPATTVTNIIYDAANSGFMKIDVTDVNGKLIVGKMIRIDEGEGRYKLDVSNYLPGVYYVTTIIDGHSNSQKFIKIR